MGASVDNAVAAYLKKVDRAYRGGKATEHTYRPFLIDLIHEVLPGTTAVNEPKQRECGAPDIVLATSRRHGRGAPEGDIFGFIETKPLGADLEKIENSEQLKRYRSALGNLVLTDYIEFRWYVDGQLKQVNHIAELSKRKGVVEGKTSATDIAALLSMVRDNGDKAERITDARILVPRMAALTRLLKEAIYRAIEEEKKLGSDEDSWKKPFLSKLEGFRQALVHALTESEFADMLAQTFSYGLFAARIGSPEDGFNRMKAFANLPRGNHFLSSCMGFLLGADLSSRIAWAVDDIAALLGRTDINAIIMELRGTSRRDDPVIHFYEKFLSEYDPKTREARGVYYTPGPVVRYIVNSIDHLLITDFHIKDGLADDTKIPKEELLPNEKSAHRLKILDPSCGTGTFLNELALHVRQKHFKTKGGLWPDWARQNLVPRLYGFELLMAPYAIAHLKLDLMLRPPGSIEQPAQWNITLTNTLEEPHAEEAHAMALVPWLTREAVSASRVKRDSRIWVTFGNPPYSYHSRNPQERKTRIAKGQRYEVYKSKAPILKEATRDIETPQRTFIGHLLHGWDPVTNSECASYYEIDGKPLGERNPRALNDDYIKFIRFAQWRIERTGHGIVAFITNNSFLENPTCRGMRHALLSAFDSLYVLDLHGSLKKREAAPDGGKDENVFDIEQGTCIFIGVRLPGKEGSRQATLYHMDLYGPRHSKGDVGGKYDWLDGHDVSNTPWQKLTPAAPNYLFRNEDGVRKDEWEAFVSLPELMPVSCHGFKSHRDHFAVDFSKCVMEYRLDDLADASLTDEDISSKYNLKNAEGWSIRTCRMYAADAKKKGILYNDIWQALYRPLDRRFAAISSVYMDRPRKEIDRHILGRSNFALGVGRQGQAVNDSEWNLVTLSNLAIDTNAFRRGGVAVFPLYLYPDPQDLLEMDGAPRRANLSKSAVERFEEALGLAFLPDGQGNLLTDFGPEDVLAWIYAILHSPEYRRRYGSFMASEYPRIPIPGDKDLFARLVELGHELVALHTFEETAEELQPTYDIHGGHEVETPRFETVSGSKGRVFINSEQFFGNVDANVWSYRIGGYTPAEKWLKDRVGLSLTADDIQEYMNVLAIIARTIEIQSRIDWVVEGADGSPIS